MSETAASAGARLKAARERRGLSVQKAAGLLHLEPWIVEALEAGEFERVGPPVYSKGYLRRYAMLLGLPPEEILAGFGVVAPPVGAAAPAPAPEAAMTTPWSTPQMLGATAGGLLLVALLYWKPWTNPGQATPPVVQTEPAPSGERAPALVPDEPVVAQAPPPAPARALSVAGPHPASLVTPSVTRSASTDGVASSEAAEPPSEPGAGRARLRLSFTADSWVEIRDALGNKSFIGNGAANTVKTIAGQAPMHVFLRQGGGVQLEINGHTVAIGPQYFAGDVARFQAGADGVLRREPPREASASNSRPPG